MFNTFPKTNVNFSEQLLSDSLFPVMCKPQKKLHQTLSLFGCPQRFEMRRKCRINSVAKQQILDSSKLKQFADDNFEFDENGR